mgnify:CR=1 FL=1
MDCALPSCILDMTREEVLIARQTIADKKVMASWESGMTGADMARLHGLTERTIFRIKKRWSDRGAEMIERQEQT